MSQNSEVRPRRTIEERVRTPETMKQALPYFEEEEEEEEEEEGILGNEESIGLVGL